jgi:transcriptional regulator with XRE-family HTH domain
LTPEELKIYRTNQKLTQKQLAKKAGVDQSQVSRWEAGRQKIPACVVKLIQCWEDAAK